MHCKLGKVPTIPRLAANLSYTYSVSTFHVFAVLRHPLRPLQLNEEKEKQRIAQLATTATAFTATCISVYCFNYRAHIQALERSARGAEGECEAAVKRRVDIAVQQVAVWQAAAQATAKLQAAQEQKAAKATRHSEKVTI